MRGSIVALFLAALTWFEPSAASAQDRHAAMVIDANNGNVMHADQADEPRYPASLTKIMTLYMAFEAIEQGRTTYATRIKVSQEAASQPPTKLDLEPGETIALIDAMKALVTKSANDAAVAIAEHLGGTEARFARMMTDKARLFGMSRTTFRNASGLPDPQQVTTARDMLRLALRVQDDFPKHYHLFATRSFTYEGTTYRNHNNLLFRFQGTDGFKTGYIRASGFNLVASVRRGGRHVIGVVFGGRTPARRDDAMQLLLSRALMTSSPYKTRRSAPVLVAAAAPAQRQRPLAQPEPAPQPRSTVAPQPVERPRPPQFALAGAADSVGAEERPRPVMVPQRPRPAPVPLADAGSHWPVQAPEPVLAVRPPAPRSTPVEEPVQRLAFAPRGIDLAAARGTPPGTLQQQAQGLAGPPSTQIAMAGSNPAAASDSQRGAPPSTFQQQAMRLAARSGEASASPVPRPSAPQLAVRPAQVAAGGPSPSAAGGFEIQIGAYASAAEAERALSAARSTGGDLLGRSSARVAPVAREARQVFRARFVGFDSRSAASTCIELRRRQIDCFVMREE